MQKRNQINITVTADELQSFRQLAAENGRSLAQEIRWRMNNALADNGNNAGKQASHTKTADKPKRDKHSTDAKLQQWIIDVKIPQWVLAGKQLLLERMQGMESDAFLWNIEEHNAQFDTFREYTSGKDQESEPELWEAFIAEWERTRGE